MHPNILDAFREAASVKPHEAVLFYKSSEVVRSISWSQLSAKIQSCALGLLHFDVKKNDRVGLLSENRPEWVISDLGILSCGAVTVPIYPTSSAEDVKHILNDSQIEVLILSSYTHFERLSNIFHDTPRLRKIFIFDSPDPNFNFESLLEAGKRESLNQSDLYDHLMSVIRPDDVATIIYTSGTTGAAKGVMLTHRNFLANCEGARDRIAVDSTDIALSFLPLSHVFERLAGYYYMLFSGAKIAYATSMQTVIEDMAIFKPTIAAAVPRFYEKVYTKINETLQTASPFKKKIFVWALSVGKQIADEQFYDKQSNLSIFHKWTARKLVLNKIRNVFGGRLRFFISGGAPLSKEIAEFFYSAGVLILEGYGLTETSPVIAVNSKKHLRFGTVGKPLCNVEVKIASDGEILTKGPCVMKGYFNNPTATSDAIQDGWFHTGDIGEIDTDGFLKITDRKKDIIKTSGGKMIAPQNIEKIILADPLFSQIVIIGDKRNYVVALIVPNRERMLGVADKLNLKDLSYEAILKHPQVVSTIDAVIKQKMSNLANFEQIKYFALIPKEFTVESGELTPTLKIKRRVVESRYKDIIDSLYAKSPVTPATHSAHD